MKTDCWRLFFGAPNSIKGEGDCGRYLRVKL